MKTKLLIFALAFVAIFSSCKKDTIKAKSCDECIFTILFEVDSDPELDTIMVEYPFLATFILPEYMDDACTYLDTTSNEVVKSLYISRECK